MSAQGVANDDGSLTLRIGTVRASQLARLAEHLEKDLAALAKRYLETEIEAEHGLIYGPWLRRHMYRS